MLPIPLLAAVISPKNDDAVTADTILNDVGRIENAQNELSIHLSPGDRAPEQRITVQNLCFLKKVMSHEPCHGLIAFMKEDGETIEIGDRIGRSFDRHRSDQGPKSVLPQVHSPRSISACGTVAWPRSIAAHGRSSSTSAESSIAGGTSSATRSETLTPCSAAGVFNTEAVALSTSMDSVFSLIIKE